MSRYVGPPPGGVYRKTIRWVPGLVPVTVAMVAVTVVSPVRVAPSDGAVRQTLTVYVPPTGPLV